MWQVSFVSARVPTGGGLSVWRWSLIRPPHTLGLPFYKAATFFGDASPNTPSLGAVVVRPTFAALVAGYTAIVMLMCYGLSSISGCRWMYLDFLLTTGGILEEGLFAGILY
jgi:hypothetical protein